MENTEVQSGSATFGGIVGQGVTTRVLSHLISKNRLPGTMLFSGPGGVGKLAVALAVAKRLHCKEQFEEDCECQSCRAIRTGTHPDVVVLSRDRLFGVDEMREVVALAGLRSAPGQERVIILDRAENITQAASNAALKALEEPGDHVRFILITDTPAVLLPTVRSRSYRLRFGLVPENEMAQFARSVGDNPEEEETLDAIHFASGRPGLYLRKRHSSEYREVVDETGVWINRLLEMKGRPSVQGALDWKEEFWNLAERLVDAERGTHLPRGGNAREIGRHLKNPKEFPVNPINWHVEGSAAKETRWGKGRKALLLAGLLRRMLALELDSRKISALVRVQDFREKVRFNCSFDIALERLYFSIMGIERRVAP